MEIYEKYIRKNRSFELMLSEGNDVASTISSKFLEIQPDGYIISAPKKNDEIIILEVGKYIYIYLYVEDGIYRLKCKVQQISNEYYKVSHAISVEHSQRREYLRVDMRIDAKITTYRNGKEQVHNIKTNNISAKGMNFSTSEQVYTDDKIHVEFVIENRTIRTYATIAYAKRQATLSGIRFNTALSFTSISQRDIDFIAKFCLLSQLEYRQQSAKNFR